MIQTKGLRLKAYKNREILRLSMSTVEAVLGIILRKNTRNLQIVHQLRVSS